MFSASIKSGKNATGAASTPDPQFNYVTALLNGDGTNGAQNNTFVDSSTNNFAITRTGNTTQGSFSPYGPNWSNYFNGSGNYLTVAASPAIDLSGNYTIEAWINLQNTTSAKAIISIGEYFGSSGLFLFVDSTGKLAIAYSNARQFTGSGTIVANTWNHVAFVRSSGVITIYLNGVSQGTLTTSNTFTGATNYIGQEWYNGALGGVVMNGYISNLRIVQNTAVYTSAFTPPTSALTAISGTSLLTCQSNRFIDSSSNAFAITVIGSPSVQRFNPFGTSTTYSTSVIGGSGYFDGSYDYLTVAANSALTITAGPSFTMEAWVYPVTNTEGYPIIVSQDDGGNNNQCFQFRLVTSNNTLQFIYWTSSARSSAVAVTTTNSVKLNQWNHVAVCWTGTNLYLFINGIVGFSGAVSTMYGATNSPTWIGVLSSLNTTAFFKGYISNVRMIKGTALYTSNFTPPTTPLTAITNTSLLANMTNAGIYDSAMTNDYETIGTAQVSTAVKKFGTASMYFNGSTSYLKTPSSNAFGFGTGDYTVETWVYGDFSTGYKTVFDNRFIDLGIVIYLAPSSALMVMNNVAVIISGGTVPTNTWAHIAVVKNGTTVTAYLNGTSVGSATDTRTYSLSTNASIGADTVPSSYFVGYMDDFRITKYARYTANFTPPTAAFPTTGPV